MRAVSFCVSFVWRTNAYFITPLRGISMIRKIYKANTHTKRMKRCQVDRNIVATCTILNRRIFTMNEKETRRGKILPSLLLHQVVDCVYLFRIKSNDKL